MKLGKTRTITPKNFPKLQFRQSSTLATGTAWQSGDSSPDGKIVIVGGVGTPIICSSTDGGRTWANETPPSLSPPANYGLKRVKWLKDRFVAVGWSGVVLYSTGDGNWTASSNAIDLANGLFAYGIAYDPGNDRFIVSGEATDESNGPLLLVSYDGCETFERITPIGFNNAFLSDYANTIDLFNGKWIVGTAYGNIFTSDDLINWTWKVVSTTDEVTMIYGDVVHTATDNGMWLRSGVGATLSWTFDGDTFQNNRIFELNVVSNNGLVHAGNGIYLAEFNSIQSPGAIDRDIYIVIDPEDGFYEGMTMDYDGLTLSDNGSTTLTIASLAVTKSDMSEKFPGLKNVIIIDFYGQHLYSEVPF